MKFALVFITAIMSQGPANLGALPGAPTFNSQERTFGSQERTFGSSAECEIARDQLSPPASRSHEELIGAKGWQCIPGLDDEPLKLGNSVLASSPNNHAAVARHLKACLEPRRKAWNRLNELCRGESGDDPNTEDEIK